MSFEAWEARKAHLTSELDALGRLADEIGATGLATRVHRELVPKLQEERFHLVVVGEFNHGKSTFINALLGRAVLPTGVTPTTAVIHHLYYSSAPEAFGVDEGGRRVPMAMDRLEDAAVAPNGREGGATVTRVEVGYPSPLLQHGIVLVDTPGVNDLSLTRADITYEYIPRADAVLFLLDAGQILKESERAFLQQKLLAASRDKIFFVITKWDLLSPAEQAEALAYARTQLGTLLPGAPVFPVSSSAALEAARTGSEPPLFQALVQRLSTFLAEERGAILVANIALEAARVGTTLGRALDARRRAARLTREEIDARVGLLEQDLRGHAGTLEERRMRIRERVAVIKAEARKDIARFVDDASRSLPAVIDGAKGEELRKHLPAYIEETFRKFAEAEAKDVAMALEQLAEQTIALVREDAVEASKRLSDTLPDDVRRLDVRIDTFRYDVGVVALFTAGLGVLFTNVLLGGLLVLAAPLFALAVRDRIDAEYRKRAKELVPSILADAGARVTPKLDAMIDDFAKKLDEWVVAAGIELHRELLSVLRSERAARDDASRTQASALAEVERWESRLTPLLARLSEEGNGGGSGCQSS